MSACSICGLTINVQSIQRLDGVTFNATNDGFDLVCTCTALNLCQACAIVVGIYNQTLVTDSLAYNSISWGSVQWFNSASPPQTSNATLGSAQLRVPRQSGGSLIKRQFNV